MTTNSYADDQASNTLVVENENPTSLTTALPDLTSLGESDLVEEIVRCHRDSTGMAATVVKAARVALDLAIRAGAALNEAKSRCEHGHWGEWLKLHVPALSEDQACRYMKLARQIPHMRNLNEIATIRKAYLAAGVITEQAKGEAKRACKPPMEADAVFAPADVVSRFRSLRMFLDTATPRLCALVMPDSEADELAVEVGLIVGHLRDILRHLEKMPALPPVQPRALLALPAPSASLLSSESPALPPSSPTLPITPPAPEPTAPTPQSASPVPPQRKRRPQPKKSKASGKAKRAAKAARTARAVQAAREGRAASAAAAMAAAAVLAAKQNAPTATDRAVEGTSEPVTE
ncbi:MAG: DUF3102 domain-containing protein [Verrucomicrobiae bacterium]